MTPSLLLLIFGWLPLYLAVSTSDPLADGLIAHYTFNYCDARDDSGNGNTGQLIGDVSCWCGVEDDGLLFDGSRSYVEFTGSVNQYFGTSDFSISYFFKPEGYSTFPQSMLSKRESCSEYTMLDMLLDLNQKAINTLVHETPNKYYPGLSPDLPGDGWVHVALVREGIHAYTYINGMPHRQSNRCSGVDISNEALLCFGNSPCVSQGRARPFKGILDELRVYDRALGAKEIQQIYERTPIEKSNMDCYT